MENIVVIGGSNIDFIGKSYNHLIMRDSNPGLIKIAFGGVGRNIVENLARLGESVSFITAIGNDDLGLSLKKELEGLGVKVYTKNNQMNTATYLAIHDDDGDMKLALCDNEIVNNIDIDLIEDNREIIENASYIVIDTNVNQIFLDYFFRTFKNKKIIVDAISTTKAKKIIKYLDSIYILKVNEIEFQTLQLSNRTHLPKYIIKTSGSKPAEIIEDKKVIDINVKKITEIKSATGAGDSLVAGAVYGLNHGKDIIESVKIGIKASAKTLQCYDAVSKDIKDILCDI